MRAPDVRISVDVSPEFEELMATELAAAYEGLENQRPEPLEVVSSTMKLLAVDARDWGRYEQAEARTPDGAARAMFLRALAQALDPS